MDWRAPFLPASTGAWAGYPALADLFTYNGSGVMPGRTWIIAPDAESLDGRWEKLVDAPAGEEKEALFHPHLLGEKVGDKHSNRSAKKALAGQEMRLISVAADKGTCLPPVRYGFRSFDRQWIIPDVRLINRPNPELWEIRSERQVFITAPSDRSPTSGPSITISGVIPDLHHYNGRGGRAFPLWNNREATQPNMPPKLLPFLSAKYGFKVGAEDLIAYIAAIAAHPAYTARFQPDLSTPGLRIPLTADATLFKQAAELGYRVVWPASDRELLLSRIINAPGATARAEAALLKFKDGSTRGGV